ncbi:hotdog family protein [Dyella tabacisoli]|uniref:3-hydroxylacyl-ACP dehydratase n=1 Tax=Dyella tabacisoli TaxID=2282381 RepID=A0A369UMD9_9GAMM|nr:hotdog family protein [Dyella tabacisoli]RDD81701.1 3-hydroxylacyl-ACP dehydratase [Dyella tabacisoli]
MTPAIAEVVPHTGEMILLDDVVAFDAQSIVCSLTVKPGGLFNAQDGSLPAWLGVELMAQSIAAWAGCQMSTEQPRLLPVGVLLGSRHYVCDVDFFPLGSELRIAATREFHDEQGMAVFTCRIDAPGIHAEARLTVFSPPDARAFFESSTHESSNLEQPHV